MAKIYGSVETAAQFRFPEQRLVIRDSQSAKGLDHVLEAAFRRWSYQQTDASESRLRYHCQIPSFAIPGPGRYVFIAPSSLVCSLQPILCMSQTLRAQLNRVCLAPRSTLACRAEVGPCSACCAACRAGGACHRGCLSACMQHGQLQPILSACRVTQSSVRLTLSN